MRDRVEYWADEVCSACEQEIDSTTCWCGGPREEHDEHTGHMFVAYGCDCHRDPGWREEILPIEGALEGPLPRLDVTTLSKEDYAGALVAMRAGDIEQWHRHRVLRRNH